MPGIELVKTVDATCQADRQWPRLLRVAHYRYQLLKAGVAPCNSGEATTVAGERALWQAML